MKWTEEEKAYVHKHYADMPTKHIAAALGRSASKVYGYAWKAGLKKSDAYVALEKKRAGAHLTKVGKVTRFQKGSTAHNKGKTMSEDIKEKIKHTWFKKGRLPHNTKYDGYERINKDGYTEVRIKGKFKLKHRVIYEQHHGPIPKGHVVVFKDGDIEHLDIHNLECITLVEHMQRNSIVRYPSEVREIIHLTNKLKRTIHAKK